MESITSAKIIDPNIFLVQLFIKTCYRGQEDLTEDKV